MSDLFEDEWLIDIGETLGFKEGVAFEHRRLLEKLRNYSPVQGSPCELCLYEEGVFQEPCGYHKIILNMASSKPVEKP